MADEKEETKEGAAEGEKKPSALKALLVPILSSAVTAGIVGAVVAIVLAPKAPPPDADGATAESHGEESGSGHGAEVESTHGGAVEGDSKNKTGIYLNYDPFIVSIFDREKVHYLKVVLSLELNSEATKEEITAKGPQIRDSMIFVLSDFTLRELLDNQAKSMLKQILMKTLNKILGKGKIINVYFTEFTIQ